MPPAWSNKAQWLAAGGTFILSGIAAIIQQSFWWLLIPFAVVLIPVLLRWTITRTEQLFWIALCMLPLSAETHPVPSLGLDFPDEALLMILTACCLAKLLLRDNRCRMADMPSGPKSRHSTSGILFRTVVLLRNPLLLLLLLHLAWIGVCCIFSVNPLLSVKFLLAKTWYVTPLALLPAMIFRSPVSLKRVAWCLLVPMGIVVVQSLARHSLYGFSFEGIKETLFPFFRNHVSYSGMLVCLLAVLWCAIRLTPPSPAKRWLKTAMLLGLVALLFSYSRGAWVAAVIGIITGCAICYNRLRLLLVAAFVSVMALLGWLAYHDHYLHFIPDYTHTIFHKDFGEHIEATVNWKDVSDAERLYRWMAGVRMIAAKPVTGFGPNNFYDNYKAYTASAFKTWVSDNPDHSSVHNYFLLTALEQGIQGLLLFTLLCVLMLIHCQRLYQGFKNLSQKPQGTDYPAKRQRGHYQLADIQVYRYAALTTGIVLSVIGVLNCLSDLIETDKIGGLFWLSLGVIFWLDLKLKEKRLPGVSVAGTHADRIP